MLSEIQEVEMILCPMCNREHKIVFGHVKFDGRMMWVGPCAYSHGQVMALSEKPPATLFIPQGSA